MLKFLRKYKTWILVIGGSLLMIAFLLPSNFNRLPIGAGSARFMKVQGRDISKAEAALAAREHEALRRIAPVALAAAGVRPETDHWILLVKSAREMGLIGGPQDGADYIPDLAVEVASAAARRPLDRANPDDMAMLQATQQRLEENRRTVGPQLRMTERDVNQALANLRGVARMIGLYTSAGEVLSTPRIVQEARRRLDEGVIDYVFLPASSYTFSEPEPSAEQIQAHFEKYRDVEPGKGEYGLGYRALPRFKIEYLTLSRAAFASVVSISPVDVRKTFMQETPGGTEEQFQAARAEIEARLKEARIDKLMEEAAAIVRAEIAKSLRKAEIAGQYRQVPADWDAQRPNYDAMAAAVVGKFAESQSINIAPPQVTRRQEWVPQSSLMSLTGIGQSTIQRGARGIPFSQYVTQVRELAGSNDFALQVGVPGELVKDRNGNMYFFTVTAVKPAGPAETVDEIRTQIVTDLKRIAAFEKLKADAEAYRRQAIAGGLEPIAKPPEGSPAPAMPLAIKRDIGVKRPDFLFNAQELNTEAVKNQIMDAVAKLDPKGDVTKVDAAERILVIPIPERLGMAVVMIKGYNATSAEATRWRDFGLTRAVGGTQLREAAGADATTGARATDPFDLESLAKRYNAELSEEHKSIQERLAKEAAERGASKPAAGAPSPAPSAPKTTPVSAPAPAPAPVPAPAPAPAR